MPYVIRKVRNKNLYSVKNKATGKVHSRGSSLADAKAQVRLLESLEIKGKGLPTSTVKGLIDASYTNRTENKVGDLVLDRQLSTRKAQVYTNPKTGQVVVANRGTTGTVSDWTNNALYSVGLYGTTDRMKQAERVQKAAIKKYGHVDVNVGHSQGGIITRRLNDKGLTGEVINVNPASMGERHKKNETVLRSSMDLVSAMHKGKNRTHVVKGITNPLEEHSTKFLDRMKKEFVGKGVVNNETTSQDLDEYMDAFDIKNYHGTYIKDELPELNDGFYIINLNGHSHWTALLVDNGQYYYFDPFGFPAPTEVEQSMYKDAGQKVRYVYNTEQVQDIDHTSCGFYCVAWIRYMSKKAKDKSSQFEKFLEIFDDPPTNDKELKKLLKI